MPMLFFITVIVFSILADDHSVYYPPNYHFIETFDTLDSERWIPSQASKADSPSSKYTGEFEIVKSNGKSVLSMKQPSSHYGLSAKLEKPFDFMTTNDLYFQFEVTHNSKPDCGGAYIKLISSDEPLEQMNDVTPFTIMFGPDVCGVNANYHFIINYVNPVTGVREEKKTSPIESFTTSSISDGNTHLYTLALHSDGKYRILFDGLVVQRGDITTDMIPPINPPKDIPDETATKPEDWDDREEIIDESVTKPDDWDEGGDAMIPDMKAVKPSGWRDNVPLMIPDTSETKPEDWDDELDGDWEAPLINNPECSDGQCGEWNRPLVDNPKYKGHWKPSYKSNPSYMGKWVRPQIPNPHYFNEPKPYVKLLPIATIAFELWTVEGNVHFDNIIITCDSSSLNNWTTQTFIFPPSKSSKYLHVVKEYVTQNWIIIGLVISALVLFFSFFRWLRSSPSVEETIVETSQTEESDGVVSQSDDEGVRQRIS